MPRMIGFVKLNPAISVLAIVAAAFVGLGCLAARQDECSYTPGGKLSLTLASQRLGRILRPGTAQCDPWSVVEPDPSISSISIEPSSNWTFSPSRIVNIRANGDLSVTEPLDFAKTNYRKVASATDPALARKLLSSLSRFTRFNRLMTENLETYAAEHPDPEGGFDIRHYMVGPTLKCWGTLYDGGAITLKFVTASGEERKAVLNSNCNSPSMETATKESWNARVLVFKRIGYKGDDYVRDLKPPL